MAKQFAPARAPWGWNLWLRLIQRITPSSPPSRPSAAVRAVARELARLTRVQKFEIGALAELGVDAVQIAARLGLGEYTVREVLRRDGRGANLATPQRDDTPAR